MAKKGVVKGGDERGGCGERCVVEVCGERGVATGV